MKHTTSTWMQLVLSHMLLPARCSSQESAIGSETSRKSSLGTTKERRFFFFGTEKRIMIGFFPSVAIGVG